MIRVESHQSSQLQGILSCLERKAANEVLTALTVHRTKALESCKYRAGF